MCVRRRDEYELVLDDVLCTVRINRASRLYIDESQHDIKPRASMWLDADAAS